MSTLARTARVSLVALMLAGCRGDGLPYEDLQAAKVAALCDYLVRCGVASDEALCLGDAAPTAWATYWAPERIPDLERLLASGEVLYHEEQAQACLRRISEAACTTSELIAIAQATSGPCSEILTGTVADGGACWLPEQCVSGWCPPEYCPSACCPGVCASQVPPAQLGEPCFPGLCVDGAYCSAETSTCVPQKPSGAACDLERPGECDDPLQCVRDSAGIATCQGYPAVDERCVNGGCDIGLVCSSATVTCVQIPGEGEACELGRPGNCALGLRCDDASATCVRLAAGEPCALGTLGLDCPEGAYCRDYVCEPLRASDAQCEAHQACASRYCDPATNTCAQAPVCAQ